MSDHPSHPSPAGDRTEQILTAAEAAAHRLAHHYIGTEHLLVALARSPQGGVPGLLAGFGLDAETLETALETLLGRGQSALGVRPPLTSSASLVLQRARWEARQRGAGPLGPAHVLLAVTKLVDSTASTVQRELGIAPEALHQAVLDTLADELDGAASAGSDDPAVPAVTAAQPTGDPVAAAASDAFAPPVEADPLRVDEPLAIQVVRLTREVAALRAEVERLTRTIEGDPPRRH